MPSHPKDTAPVESVPIDTVIDHLRGQFVSCFGEAKDAAGVIAGNRQFMRQYARIDDRAPPLHPATRIIADDRAPVQGEWVLASGADPAKRLLWIHGGGGVSGRPADYRTITEPLSRESGGAVFAVDYRLAPEHKFPAGLEDSLTAFQWLADHGPEGEGPAAARWVAGDSAGANLTLALLLKLKMDGLALPDAAATIGASTDMTASAPSMESRKNADPIIARKGVLFVAQCSVPEGMDHTDPLVSPLFGDLAGLPPLLMHVGDRETLLDDTTRFAEKARNAGSPVTHKVWPEMIHVFEMFSHVLPEARQSLAEIGRFLKSHDGTTASRSGATA